MRQRWVMKRNVFIFLSAIISGILSLIMMFAPDKMLLHIAGETTIQTKVVMQWFGMGVFSLSCINFFCRNAHGSKSLKAIMGGNLIFNFLAIVFAIIDYSTGIMILQGLVIAGVIHVLLAGGFAYFLLKMKETTLMSSSRHS